MCSILLDTPQIGGMENWINEWYRMEWVPSHSIPFHSFFTKPNNGTWLHPTPFHSIPSLSTNLAFFFRWYFFFFWDGLKVWKKNGLEMKFFFLVFPTPLFFFSILFLFFPFYFHFILINDEITFLFVLIKKWVLLATVPGALVKVLKVERKVNFCIKKNTFLTFKM